jgi:hypothetical protein
VSVRGVVLVVLLGLVAACSGGAGPPSGFTQVSDGPAGFAYPEGWEMAQREGSNIVALGETGAGDLRQNAILQIDPTFSGDFELVVDGLNDLANAEFPDREVLADEPVVVPGAQHARLLTSTYRQPADPEGPGDGELVEIRQYDLFALGSSGTDQTLYLLQVGSPVELFDEQRFRQIVDSFAIDG